MSPRTPAGLIVPPTRDGTVGSVGGWQLRRAATMPSDHEAFVHRDRGLTGVRSRDLGRWHLSVSHYARIPTWAELGFARDSLLPPDVWLMIAHPPRKYWLNLDRRVLHLWEFRDTELIEQFRSEGEQAQSMGFGSPDSGEAV